MLIFISCEKKILVPPTPEPNPVPLERSPKQKIMDEIYRQYKNLSLWTDDIPEVNPPYTFTDRYTSEVSLLSQMKFMTKPMTSDRESIDRYSYLTDLKRSPAARADVERGHGLYLSLVKESVSTGYYYVSFITANSPAYQSGLRRGDRILKLGDTEMKVTFGAGGNSQEKDRIMNNALNGSNSIYLTIGRIDQLDPIVMPAIRHESYEIHPINAHAIFEYPTKKIGYISISSFEEIFVPRTDNVPANMKINLDQIFEEFDNKQVDDLIFDLRYNTGGYVESAIYLANKAINTNGNNKLMFKYELNRILNKNKPKGFEDVFYHKTSKTNFKNVYFLVTLQTASAAEMFISVLLPYYPNYVILAETNRTYGKPVGFYNTDIKNDNNQIMVQLWAASFKMVNKEGYTNFFSGIKPDDGYIKASQVRTEVINDVKRNFGDPKEYATAEAINHSTTGRFSIQTESGRKAVKKKDNFIEVENAIRHLNQPRQRNLLKY